jgi:hypothetical protein
MENSPKVFSKVLTALLAGLLVYSCVGAAELTTVFRLNMDGAIEADEVTYSGDSGVVPVPVSVQADEYGNLPDLTTTPGMMYTNGKSSGPSALDEVMLVNVGPGYNLEESYIFEAWVKPDYANLPTASDNQWGQIWMFKWWEIGDWCDVAGTISDNVGMAITADGYGQRMQAGDTNFFYNYPDGDPNGVLSATEFSHVALVWEWDDGSSTGTASYYVNGQFKASASGTTNSALGLPENFGVANHCFTAMDNGSELGCGADVNFNGGFSGWIDSMAVSTFTGGFEGPQEFALVDPQFCGDVGTEFKDGDLNFDCKVDLLDFSELANLWLAE